MAAKSRHRWSARVMERSNALDLEKGVFKQDSPQKIARSLKRSAERSRRKKSSPFRSAMSMLTFHLNRGGKGLPAVQRKRLEAAKDELRDLFGRKPHGKAHGARRRSHARKSRSRHSSAHRAH